MKKFLWILNGNNIGGWVRPMVWLCWNFIAIKRKENERMHCAIGTTMLLFSKRIENFWFYNWNICKSFHLFILVDCSIYSIDSLFKKWNKLDQWMNHTIITMRIFFHKYVVSNWLFTSNKLSEYRRYERRDDHRCEVRINAINNIMWIMYYMHMEM